MYDFVIVNIGHPACTQQQSLNSYADKLRAGMPLSRHDAYQLIRGPEHDLPALLSAAVQARKRLKPGVITYSRKVFIPLTNLCRDYCGYCTFRRDPGQPGAHTMTPEQVLDVARAGEKMGCTCLLYTSPSPRDGATSRMPSSA